MKNCWLKEKILKYKQNPIETLKNMLETTNDVMLQYKNNKDSKATKGLFDACIEHNKIFLNEIKVMETLRFGKYKGLTYEEVRKKSPSYFTWLWFNIKEKLDKPLYDYIETNLKELKKEADDEHAFFMYHYCNGEVDVEY